ncbi:OmpA family protein [Humitalea sp. 24SJ18S-53]|uniref:OmpA family protein n=1 Tax=Humitalea sp. 24SJ18S-53 TaxID=3422307 RepID=UPI003D67AD82
MKHLIPGLLFGLLAAAPAMAQVRSFSCIGAERLEDDVFEVPFRNGRPEPTAESLRTPLAAVVALAREDPARNICVLGHARQEGGQTTGTQLAARRARAVAQALSAEGGIERDRIRAEARNPAFSRSAAAAVARRAVTIVVLP